MQTIQAVSQQEARLALIAMAKSEKGSCQKPCGQSEFEVLRKLRSRHNLLYFSIA
jgi:hypothetical protein